MVWRITGAPGKMGPHLPGRDQEGFPEEEGQITVHALQQYIFLLPPHGLPVHPG